MHHAILDFDFDYIMDITTFEESYVGRLEKYFSKLSRLEKMELHRRANCLRCDQKFVLLFEQEKETEFSYAMFLLAMDELMLLEIKASKMGRMSLDERNVANARKISRISEKKKKKSAPTKFAIEQSYLDIRDYLKAGLSWRDVVLLLPHDAQK